MSEETKIAKFEVMIDEIREWFGETRARYMYDGGFSFCFATSQHNYRLSFFDTYRSNLYIDVLLQKAGGTGFFSPEDDVVGLCRICSSSQNHYGVCDTRNRLIFWMLFMAALDDEIYNSELDSIIDIAYSTGFNEAMILDWCHAVEYILQGNQFSKNCNLEYATEEGKKFFLHQDN